MLRLLATGAVTCRVGLYVLLAIPPTRPFNVTLFEALPSALSDAMLSVALPSTKIGAVKSLAALVRMNVPVFVPAKMSKNGADVPAPPVVTSDAIVAIRPAGSVTYPPTPPTTSLRAELSVNELGKLSVPPFSTTAFDNAPSAMSVAGERIPALTVIVPVNALLVATPAAAGLSVNAPAPDLGQSAIATDHTGHGRAAGIEDESFDPSATNTRKMIFTLFTAAVAPTLPERMVRPPLASVRFAGPVVLVRLPVMSNA